MSAASGISFIRLLAMWLPAMRLLARGAATAGRALAGLAALPTLAALAGLVTLVTLLGLPRPAAAHQTSMKQLDLRVTERSAEVTLRASFDDIASAVGRDPEALSRAELLADPAVVPTVTSWVKLLVGAAPCPVAAGAAITEDRDPRFLAVRWRADCPDATRALTLELEAFFALDATHTMVVHLEGQGAALDTVVGVDDSPLTVRLSAPPRSFPRWVHLGMEHIFGGTDHVCFVIALLLAAVLVRSRDSDATHRFVGGTTTATRRGAKDLPGACWRLRPASQTLRSTALLVTSFSVAHSLTLIAASLEWVELPDRLVETAIAASIAYAAIENAIRPAAPRRWLLTFGFGLIHGLGFASALRELLPPDRVLLPLLAFNLGVELGQLVIVAVALPLLLALAQVLRAHRYRTRFLPLSSILLGSLALMWSLERAFAFTIW